MLALPREQITRILPPTDYDYVSLIWHGSFRGDYEYGFVSALVLWCFGALVLWCFGALVLWCFGASATSRFTPESRFERFQRPKILPGSSIWFAPIKNYVPPVTDGLFDRHVLHTDILRGRIGSASGSPKKKSLRGATSFVFGGLTQRSSSRVVRGVDLQRSGVLSHHQLQRRAGPIAFSGGRARTEC